MTGRLLTLTWLLGISAGAPPGAQAPRVPEERALRGTVITHEDAPVTSGTVVLEGMDRSSINAAIDRDGRFRAVLSAAGLHRLTITVPGFAPHRVNVNVPSSRNMALPPIRLDAPTYYRARFVTAAGEAILSPNLRRRLMNADGFSFGTTDTQAPSAESDGATMVGPLPRGITYLALDMPMLAMVPAEIPVTGSGERVVDGGTIVVHPGTVLHVDIVDGAGAPVRNHSISIEPVAPFSALTPRSALTNKEGRVTFDRLAAGRYRVNTTAVDRCNGGVRLPASQLVFVNGTGEVRQQMELDGLVRLLVSSPYGPLAGAQVAIAPEQAAPPIPGFPRIPGRPSPPVMMAARCSDTTDAEGRVSFTNVPPGPIRMDVRSGNSTYQRTATVGRSDPELPFAIPDGFLQLQVTNELTGAPVVNALVTWNGNGYRVTSTTNGLGAALLEGVGDGSGLIQVGAPGFAAGSARTTISPLGTHETTLRPDPPAVRRVRVAGPAGEPVAGAIVELLPPTVFDVGVFAVTDTTGAVAFSDAPPGALSAIASADGFAPVSFSLSGDTDAPVVVTLKVAR